MPRRKKLSASEKALNYIKAHRRLSLALVIAILILCYFPLHAYRIYADEHKFSQSRSAIDDAYSKISSSIGEADDIKRQSSCFKDSGLLRDHVTCAVETDFIYSSANQNQANTLMGKIQQAIAASHHFKPSHKLSKALSNDLVYDTYYHDAEDTYRGPHGIDCSVKYSFDTLDEVDLTWRDQSLKPFEIFFSCSGGSAKTVY